MLRLHQIITWPFRIVARTNTRWWREDAQRPPWQQWAWTVALGILLLLTAYQLGAFHWYTAYPVELADGSFWQLPNTYASIDHPFHIAKERATVDALRAGHLPAWFANHQGGFPAEFYPTGSDLLVALAYLLTFELIPLAVIHKLVVIAVFFLPTLAYWAIARREKLPLSVAFLAAILHLFVRGNWLAGGSRELIDYGLWPDVFASYLPLFVILWGGDWLRYGKYRGLILAAGAATLAIYSNPRSVIGLAAAALALGLITLIALLRQHPPRQQHRWNWRKLSRALLGLVGRSTALVALIGCLAAALLLPLRDNQALYTFTIYFRFENLGQVWSDPTHGNGIGYIESVLPQLIALAGIGIVFSLLRPGFYQRVIALLLPLSYLIIVLVGWTWQQWPIFAQLEGQRLMPMLRPATIFLAALGAHELLRLLLRFLRLRGQTVLTGLATSAVALVLLLHPQVPLDLSQRGLPLEQTTDQPAFTAIARSALLVNAFTTAADKPLILGNNMISWHDSFWIPALTGSNVYHNDWLWFWRTTEYGAQELMYDNFAALDSSFLYRHGLTVVLIDANDTALIARAESHDYLERLDAGTPGGYALYRVVGPLAPPNGYVIPDYGTVDDLSVQPEAITATITSAQPQLVRVIVNDFPRWQAQIDGQPAPITPTADGYISLALPAGQHTITVRYTTSTANWLGRALVTLGLLTIVGIVVWRTLRKFRRR